MVCRCFSFSKGPFSGSMLVFRGVCGVVLHQDVACRAANWMMIAGRSAPAPLDGDVSVFSFAFTE